MERESIAPDDLLTVIKTRLQSGKPPDVFNYGTGPGFAGAFDALSGIGFDGYMAMECSIRGYAREVLPETVRRLRSWMG